MQNYNEIFEQNVERLSATQKMLTDQANTIFQTTLTSATKLLELQAAAAQASFQRNLSLLGEVKNLRKGEDVVDLQKKVCENEAEILMEQSKKATEIFFETQEQIESLAIENFEEMNASVNKAIDNGFKAANGAATYPAAVLLKQGIDTQREAFNKAYGMWRQGWEQSLSQLRETGRQGVDKVQEVQKATKTTRGRRKA